MRLNHKCKVASATARLYSLVAYQAIDALPSIHAVPVWRFTSPDLPVTHTKTHKASRGCNLSLNIIILLIHSPGIS